MSNGIVFGQVVEMIALAISLGAACGGLISTSSNPRHPLSRTSPVTLAKVGFGCLISASLLCLLALFISFVDRVMPAGSVPDQDATGAVTLTIIALVSALASLLSASGLVMLVLSVGKFMKLGTGEKA